LRVYSDLAGVSEAVAESITEKILTAAASRRFHLALAGGNTPRTLYRLLATDFRDRIPWDHVHLFWCDERYVPPNDPRSNYHLAQENLLDHINIPAGNIHQMRTDFVDPDDAAKSYEMVLRDYFSPPWPSFSLVLLGLGVDGHTASLFPDSPVLEERRRWVVSALDPTEPLRRLTLTLPAIAHAEQIYFVVGGSDKANALQRTLTEGSNSPAARLMAERPDSVFWTDEAASRIVKHESMPSIK
jgi:6-phosphogluconolactonase